MGATDVSVIDGLDTGAAELRAGLEIFQQGVLAAGDFKVTPRAAGSNRSVDIAAGRAVLSSPLVTQPQFHARNFLVSQEAGLNSDQFELGGIAAPHATYARLDQLVARLYNNEAGLRKWRFEILTGTTPTQNATLDNRHNAAALPAGVAVMRIADIVVPTTGVITATEIRDRRPWARGAYRRIQRNANAGGGNDYSTTSTSLVEVDATNLRPRFETSGNPVRLNLRSRGSVNTPTVGKISFYVDGVNVDNFGTESLTAFQHTGAGGGAELPVLATWTTIPAAGSHTFSPWYTTGAGTFSIYARAGIPMIFEVQELLLQNADNS